MANRYLQANGNWNGPVWAATSGGAAGSASTPTASDFVRIQADYTVTVNTSVSCGGFYLTQGGLNITSSGSLTATSFEASSYGGDDFNKSITVNGRLTVDNEIIFGTGSGGLSTNFSGSIVTLNVTGVGTFETRDITFNDMIINMGMNSASATIGVYGSPTFRSLIIQSKNSAAHTVNIEDWQTLTCDKFVALGTSSGRLTFDYTDGDMDGFIEITDNGTCYGQHLYMAGVAPVLPANDNVKYYIGSNSAQADSDWLLQDPPKISTLVDPLTTAPGGNPNWTVSGTVTQVTSGHAGGGYKFSSGASMVSTDTYDLFNSGLVLETADDGLTLGLVGSTIISIYVSSQWVYVSTPSNPYAIEDGPSGAAKFVKLSVSSSNVLSVKYSNDGISWSNGQLGNTYTLTADEVALIKSMRLGFSGANAVIGSINPPLNASPTTVLNSPANNTTLTTTTPTLAFTATDPEGEQVSYQIQVSTSPGFTTTHMDVTTTTYASGTQQTRVVSPALTQGGITYYWRVRAKDPSGSNTYGAWSWPRTFKVADSSRNFLAFFYP